MFNEILLKILYAALVIVAVYLLILICVLFTRVIIEKIKEEKENDISEKLEKEIDAEIEIINECEDDVREYHETICQGLLYALNIVQSWEDKK